MAPRVRTTQHRPRHEEQSREQRLAELKRENHKLTRENARLRKLAGRPAVPEPTDPEAPRTEAEVRSGGKACPDPECSGMPMVVVDLGERVFYVCKYCKHRERKS